MATDINGIEVEITPDDRIYIAGPISSYGKANNWNRDSFEAVQDRLYAQFGASATIPHEFVAEDDPYEKQMADCYEFLRNSVDTVVLLSDWEISNGATNERMLAEELGYKIIVEDDL